MSVVNDGLALLKDVQSKQAVRDDRPVIRGIGFDGVELPDPAIHLAVPQRTESELPENNPLLVISFAPTRPGLLGPSRHKPESTPSRLRQVDLSRPRVQGEDHGLAIGGRLDEECVAVRGQVDGLEP
jgi:hypothetical protein